MCSLTQDVKDYVVWDVISLKYELQETSLIYINSEDIIAEFEESVRIEL